MNLTPSPRRADAVVWWTAPLREDARVAEFLDDDERARCERYVRAADRARFVSGRLLARRAVAAELGCAPCDVTLVVSCRICGANHGKPSVAGAARAIDLSIAHAEERVVVAVARGCAVGVDVECVRPIADLDSLAATALDHRERAVLAALSPAERTAGFHRYWTRKEALLKATGLGLAIAPHTVHVTPPGSDPALLEGPPELSGGQVWMRDLDAGAGYVACIALLLEPDVAEPRLDHVRVSARELAHSAQSSA